MTKLLIKKFVKNCDDVENTSVRNRYSLLSNITGMIANVVLCITKLILGLTAGSVGVITDAFNNLSDAGSNVVTILGFHLSQKQADEKHPYGHGRIEYLTALIVNIMIITVSVELFHTSVQKIQNHVPTKISPLFIIIISLTVLVKLWLFFFYRKISKIINSAAIKATALDSIVDVVTTSLVLVCSVASLYTPVMLDGWAGIIVSFFIFLTACKALKEPIDLLLGTAPDPTLVSEIEEFVKQYPDIIKIHDLIVHDYGPMRLIITLHAEISADISLIKAHRIIDQIEEDMKKRFHCQVTIHPDPVEIKK